MILPPPTSRFRPLAPYCPLSWHLTAKNSSPGWHPTAPFPPAGSLLLPSLRLAPYCSLPSGWHPTAPFPPARTLLLPSLRLAPYCSLPSGWHPTAPFPPAGTLLLPSLRLAPYCYSPAGILLLLTGWHPTAHRRWVASPLPGGSARLPASLPPAIYSTVANLA